MRMLARCALPVAFGTALATFPVHAQPNPGLASKPSGTTVDLSEPSPRDQSVNLSLEETRIDLGVKSNGLPYFDTPPVPSEGFGVVKETVVAGKRQRPVADQQASLERAKVLLGERNPAAASVLLEQLLQENADIPDARYQAALAAQMAADRAKASSLAAEAMSRGENSAPLQMLIGFIAMQEKKYSEALAAFEQAAQLDPEDAMALYNQSEALREQGRPKESVAVLQRAQKLDSKRKLLALKSRLAQLEAGENVKEIELEVMKRRAEEKQTEDWHMTAAAIYLRDGSYRQAIDALRDARSVMGSNQLRAIFGQDHFFRQFADDQELAEFRDEIGLE